MDNNTILNEWISLVETNLSVKLITGEIVNLEGPKIEFDVKVNNVFVGKIRVYVYANKIAVKTYTNTTSNTKLCTDLVLALVQNWHNAVDYFNKIIK